MFPFANSGPGDRPIEARIGPCPADFDGDATVGAADLAQLLGSWGPCADPCEPGDPEETCPADFDGDCEVGASDLVQLLGDWGLSE